MLNDAVNEPDPSVVAVVWVVEPYAMVIVDDGEKLLPDTVTSVPGGPVVGLRLIPITRVKIELAEFASESVAVIV